VPYAARSRATASSGSQSLSSAKIERLLDSLRNTRAAEATKQRARGRRAIETEQHAVRMEPDVQAHNQGSIGQSTAADSLSMQPNNRQRSSLTVAPTRRSSTFSCCHRCHATLRQCLTSRCTPSSQNDTRAGRAGRSGTLLRRQLRRQRSCKSQQSSSATGSTPSSRTNTRRTQPSQRTRTAVQGPEVAHDAWCALIDALRVTDGG